MYYDEFEVGQKATSAGRTITDGMATALINIGGFTAPQFNDETVAKETPLGWRALPGRITLALMGGLIEQMSTLHGPGVGLLVGINNVKWSAPLRVGDTVHLEFEITEKRKTKNPRWGLIVWRERLINGRGEAVCETDTIHLMEYKPT